MSESEIVIAIILGILCAMMVLMPIFIIFHMKKKDKPVGSIVIFDNDGNYEWHFAFREGITYDMIANMDQATFKIKKGDKTDDIHGSDGNNGQGK